MSERINVELYVTEDNAIAVRQWCLNARLKTGKHTMPNDFITWALKVSEDLKKEEVEE